MEDLKKKVIQFRDEWDWGGFHNSKDLAISLSLEDSELLENFQWKGSTEALKNIENIKEELADALIYSLLLSHELNLNIEEIVQQKLHKNDFK